MIAFRGFLFQYLEVRFRTIARILSFLGPPKYEIVFLHSKIVAPHFCAGYLEYVVTLTVSGFLCALFFTNRVTPSKHHSFYNSSLENSRSGVIL